MKNWIDQCHFGDCLETMRGMPDGIVQTCVTSPPYFGLRDYGHDGQIGLEATPDQFIAKLVDVFREVKRVLKDDGTLFIVIGDSYSSSSRREAPCGTSGKAPVNSQAHDCLCGNLCDACRKAYRIGKSHSGSRLAPMPHASLCESSRERMEVEHGHPPTSDSLHQAGRNSSSTPDHRLTPEFSDDVLLASLVSTSSEFSQQHHGSCLEEQTQVAGCLLCGGSLQSSSQEFARRFGDSEGQHQHKKDSALLCGQQEKRSQYKDTACEYCGDVGSYHNFTTPYHAKSKDLIGIPWLLAFALRADGWYLRQEIIWHKPNPMPESVTDRCTKSHESIFLLAKSEKYYFDNGAIKEPAAPSSIARWDQDIEGQVGSDRVPGKTNGNMKAVGGKGGKNAFRGQGHHRDGENGPANREGRDMQDVGASETRNKRSVWTVATTPYKGAHFATFPTALIEPCILAGAPAGGVVLDPFGGSGTTAQVAQSLGRKWILCELNEAYRPLIEARTVQPSLDFQQPCDTTDKDTSGFEVDLPQPQSQTIEMA